MMQPPAVSSRVSCLSLTDHAYKNKITHSILRIREVRRQFRKRSGILARAAARAPGGQSKGMATPEAEMDGVRQMRSCGSGCGRFIARGETCRSLGRLQIRRYGW
jgi:hypothetical protein